MIRCTELPLPSDLENFWLDELEKASDLSYRLSFLVAIRKSLSEKLFAALVKRENFLRLVETYDWQARKWDACGRKPSDDTIEAFLRMGAGAAFEDVLNDILDQALSRSTKHNTKYEKGQELALRKQAITKRVYRVKKSLEAAGFSVRHKSKLSKELAKLFEMAKFAESSNAAGEV